LIPKEVYPTDQHPVLINLKFKCPLDQSDAPHLLLNIVSRPLQRSKYINHGF